MMKKPLQKSKWLLVGLLTGVLIVTAVWLFLNRLEFSPPTIAVTGLADRAGLSQNLEIHLQDKRAGLSHVSVILIQQGKTHSLFTRNFTDNPKEFKETIPLKPGVLKLAEGPAELVITAGDASLWGSEYTYTRNITLDLSPPRISLLTPVNYFNIGGTGMIAYNVNEPLAGGGVLINDVLYPAHLLSSAGNIFVSFLPLSPYLQPGTAQIHIVAEDTAGNKSRTSVPHRMRPRKFPEDRMNLTDSFLQAKMPEFVSRFPELAGKTDLEVFISVNDKMRKDNFQEIVNITSRTEPRQLWQGPFLRLPNSSPMAGFGEKRTYVYQGKVVGESIHEGVDLASTRQAPIPAANHGRVAFADYLGIYGQTVIIDHGLGIFSLYSHLTDLATRKDAEVKKGDIIGTTGISGLAGGDHLHFAILASGRFVNPIEWWDPKWINDNITAKLPGHFR
jgi:hypothetical protein